MANYLCIIIAAEQQTVECDPLVEVHIQTGRLPQPVQLLAIIFMRVQYYAVYIALMVKKRPLHYYYVSNTANIKIKLQSLCPH